MSTVPTHDGQSPRVVGLCERVPRDNSVYMPIVLNGDLTLGTCRLRVPRSFRNYVSEKFSWMVLFYSSKILLSTSSYRYRCMHLTACIIDFLSLSSRTCKSQQSSLPSILPSKQAHRKNKKHEGNINQSSFDKNIPSCSNHRNEPLGVLLCYGFSPQ